MVHLIHTEICKCVFRQVNAKNKGQITSKLPPFAVPSNSGRPLSEEVAPPGAPSYVCTVSSPHCSETDIG